MAGRLPAPYQSLLFQTDLYAQSLNLRFFALPLPFPENSQQDTEGIRLRLRRNRSFLKTTDNPFPPEPPSDLLDVSDVNAERLVEESAESLRGPGLLVTLIEPLKGATNSDTIQEARPIAGLVVTLDEDAPSERSIQCAFCRRHVPTDVAEELLLVVLIRGIVEGLTYESNSNMPASRHFSKPSYLRERRFISISTSDLLLCPAITQSLIREKIPFVRHVDKDGENSDEDAPKWGVVKHQDDLGRECNCRKEYRKMLRQTNTTPKGYYEFWILTEIRGIRGGCLAEALPARPSPEAMQFCRGSREISRTATNNGTAATDGRANERHVPHSRKIDLQDVDARISSSNKRKSSCESSSSRKEQKTLSRIRI